MEITASLNDGATTVGLPESLTSFIIGHQPAFHQLHKREFSPRTFSSGCTDNFAIFAFLAFLLTVLDLIMEMQGMKRRKRETITSSIDYEQNQITKNATVATYTLLRGFLNAEATENEDCRMLFFCESGSETASYGPVAKKIATLAGHKVMELLGSQEVENALLEGLNKRPCSYHCREMPESYRHPGQIITELKEEQGTHQMLLDAIDKAWTRKLTK